MDTKTTVKQIYDRFLLINNRRSYFRKDIVFNYNDTADEVYAIEYGLIRYYTLSLDGKEVTFDVFNTGDIFGFREIFLGCQRTSCAEALCTTSLLKMSKKQVMESLFSDEEILFKLCFLLNLQIQKYQDTIEDLATLSVKDRLIRLFERLDKKQPNKTDIYAIIDPPITHDIIAQMIGSSRQTTTLLLNDLRRQGVLKRKISKNSRKKLTNNYLY